jgi:predicted fused transcriptional regulator/phosphomethylpyrimidine kinase
MGTTASRPDERWESERDRYYVLGNVLAGLALLEESEAFAGVIPEVRSNLAMAVSRATAPDDVVGIPGRIAPVFGRPRAVARPAFGGSHYTARILLAARREMPHLRAALEIKYAPEILTVIEQLGLAPRSVDELLAESAGPDALAAGLGRVFREAYSEERKVSVAYSTGGHAREGATILVAETAVDAARMAISIAEAYAESR